MPITANLVDVVWGAARPPLPDEKPFVLPLLYAGKKWQDKVKELRATMEERRWHAVVVSRLDEVAWLFNMRGDDIPYNPVFKVSLRVCRGPDSGTREISAD